MVSGESIRRTLAKVLAASAIAAATVVGASGIASADGCGGPCHKPSWEDWAQGDGKTFSQAVTSLANARRVLCGDNDTIKLTNPAKTNSNGSITLRQLIRCD
ncbi:hypothetical protein FXN61_00935 [Lentzea sp. PSKA42]|uniref:Secreted protein n=1 Tax=Lentzea indica TaxID=2604800 RepID=A0ABX1F9H0_9PSEU|nr:hypothetical protein [Lentzea indica]NKE55460.1 hypothetical protein [Lentzea indica]